MFSSLVARLLIGFDVRVVCAFSQDARVVVRIVVCLVVRLVFVLL